MENFEREAIELKAKVKHTLSLFLKGSEANRMMENIIMKHGILSGSAMSSIYHNESINDFDIYFINDSIITNVFDMVKASQQWMDHVADWNAYQGNTDIPVIDGKCVTKRAITFKNKVQFIIMAPLEKCRPTFDFVHCMPYYDLAYDKLYISERQLWSIKNKTLILNPKREKPPTQERIEKFQKRGWKLDIRKSVIPSSDLTKVAELV